MIESLLELEPERPRRATSEPVTVGEGQVWVVVSGISGTAPPLGEGIDLPAPLLEASLRVCKGILPGGCLVLGDADPVEEERMAELLRRDVGGAA